MKLIYHFEKSYMIQLKSCCTNNFYLPERTPPIMELIDQNQSPAKTTIQHKHYDHYHHQQQQQLIQHKFFKFARFKIRG